MRREATELTPDPTIPESNRAPFHRYLLLLGLASVGCLSDLFSKHWIFEWRGMPGEQPPWWLFEEYVGIETSLNTGALFGLGQGGVAYLAVFSIIALVGIIYWFVFSGAGKSLFLTITFGCILGGVLGNLYDRMGLWAPIGPDGDRFRAVRDWILFQYSNDLKWPNFNIADALLVCGAVSLFIYSLRVPPEKK